MDHVVQADEKMSEMEKLACGSKRMIVRGITRKTASCGHLSCGDVIYFTGGADVRLRAIVKDVIDSRAAGGLDAETLVVGNIDKLGFTESEAKKWSRRKNILLVEMGRVEKIEPFPVELENGSGGWHAVGYINRVRRQKIR